MPDGQHIIFRYKGQLVMRLANGTDQRVLVPDLPGWRMRGRNPTVPDDPLTAEPHGLTVRDRSRAGPVR